MKKRILMMGISVLLVVAGIVFAHTMVEMEKTCPLCNHTFTCTLDASGTRFDMRLDLKPIGPTPAPWRIPVCPKCRFVLYDDEIPAEELDRCKEIIAKEDYTKHSDRASYFLLGLLYEGLGKESLRIGHTFLKASWQEESDSDRLKDDLQRSLKQFEIYLNKNHAEKGEARQTAQILKGELLRRLGRFDEASDYLKGLRENRDFQDGILKDIVSFQLRLCGEKDSEPHVVSEVGI